MTVPNPNPVQCEICVGLGERIGREIALLLVKHGADVTVADLDQKGADAVAEESRSLGRRSRGVKVNVANRAEVTAVVRDAIEHFGDLDILVNNAGNTRDACRKRGQLLFSCIQSQ